MKSDLPLIKTDRLVLRVAISEDIPQIIRYFTVNKDHLTPFSPSWAEGFFTPEYWQYQVEQYYLEIIHGCGLRFFIYHQNQPQEIIGVVNFSNFLRGAANYCNVGYSLAAVNQGYGYMTEALKGGINYVFQDLNFHRIMANYMPHNRRSGNVLKRLGFVVEGYARDYLLINGKWEDHILTSLTNNHWKEY
ncbi:MAG: GNAT family N-acetyltransferase [Sphaerospermopsis sp. SIO1G2]|nr:GNAT family N-acetyltransferase [Sphaerospermopsis sp. SIO1G1]NET70221.1 GNAT family N-acetyltransferase [Sphaerospermopsis sp. SIO1G2]